MLLQILAKERIKIIFSLNALRSILIKQNYFLLGNSNFGIKLVIQIDKHTHKHKYSNEIIKIDKQAKSMIYDIPI